MHRPNFSNTKVRKTCFAYMHITLPFCTKHVLYISLSHHFTLLSINQEKISHTRQTLPKEVEQEGVIDKGTPSLFLYNSNENLNDEIDKERTVENEPYSVSTNTEIDKENDRHRYSVTPNVKSWMHSSSSPPLTELLHSLGAAMRDILHLVHQNSPHENLFFGTAPMESQSSLKSRQKTLDCTRKVEEEKNANVGTPLEKLNHRSSAIKVSSQTKELKTFFSRETPGYP